MGGGGGGEWSERARDFFFSCSCYKNLPRPVTIYRLRVYTSSTPITHEVDLLKLIEWQTSVKATAYPSLPSPMAPLSVPGTSSMQPTTGVFSTYLPALTFPQTKSTDYLNWFVYLGL